MRKLQALGLLAIGIAVGAGTVAFGGRTEAQSRTVQSMDELNARFIVGDVLPMVPGKPGNGFQFVRDKQTGDCYITIKTNNMGAATVLKTDDDACSGL